MTEAIDRDLVENPPLSTTSEGYDRCLAAHVAQSAGHFSSALPGRGLSGIFKSKIGRDHRERLCGAFEVAYRKLVTNANIALTSGEQLSGVTDKFRPVVLFVTDERQLIAPEDFVSAQQRKQFEAAEGDAETVAMGFVYELIGTMARVLKESGLAVKEQEKICAEAGFGIAMDFDDLSLDKPIDGRVVAPALGYADAAAKLRLLPAMAAQHEFVHSLTDQYFAELHSAPQ